MTSSVNYDNFRKRNQAWYLKTETTEGGVFSHHIFFQSGQSIILLLNKQNLINIRKQSTYYKLFQGFYRDFKKNVNPTELLRV